MIYKNIEFFNISELEEKPGSQGIFMHRFPIKLEQTLGHNDISRGRYVSKYTTGCEIRFVTGGNVADISLTAVNNDGEVMIYKGDYLHSRYILKQGIDTLIRLDDTIYTKNIDSNFLDSERFSANVWRVIIFHDFICRFNYLDSFGYDVRPPKQDEIPQKTWLAYGSSITHGSGAQLHTNSYIMSAARELGVDVLDKGMGGSCICEETMSDYLAKEDWDFITLELGVNMRDSFTPEEFKHRTKYLLKAIKQNNPNKPVILITIFPNYSTYTDDNTLSKRNEIAFNNITRELYADYAADGYTYLVEGSDVLKQFDWLTTDLIHPSEYGHFRMGLVLADIIRDIIK